jgi:hypothetical protein
MAFLQELLLEDDQLENHVIVVLQRRTVIAVVKFHYTVFYSITVIFYIIFYRFIPFATS